MSGLEGQTIISPRDTGTIPVSDKVNHVFGAGEFLLTEPPAGAQHLVLIAESGTWRLRIGDKRGSMPSSAVPSSTVADGSGSIVIKAGVALQIQSPNLATVKGFESDAVLTFFYA